MDQVQQQIQPRKTATVAGLTGLTIGRLALAADVGVETVRYYQRRNLLKTPEPEAGAFRYYALDVVDRIRFIKRAQELGFSLDEVATLLGLEDGKNRKAIRKVGNDRLLQIRSKIADLKRIEKVLGQLIQECEVVGHARSCPIIAALAGAASTRHR